MQLIRKTYGDGPDGIDLIEMLIFVTDNWHILRYFLVKGGTVGMELFVDEVLGHRWGTLFYGLASPVENTLCIYTLRGE